MAASAYGPVFSALGVMQSGAKGPQKEQAHKYLNEFQKSKDAWTATNTILVDRETSTEVKMFAATTLKGKITYDLDQLPRDQLTGLRDSLLSLCGTYGQGPRPVRTQLCVCLARLAIQMIEWKDVLPLVGSTLGNTNGDCVLEFLQILPEEVNEGRKINLSEDELTERARELLDANAENVLRLLVNYAQSSPDAASNPQLVYCVTSWLKEIPAIEIIKSPLLDVIFTGVQNETTFEAGVDCICAMCEDTRDVDDSLDIIKVLYPKVIALRPKIDEIAKREDVESFKGITRIFAEAGEHWRVLVARMPNEFHELVSSILECCEKDKEKDSLSLTFNFWYELMQLITKDTYANARNAYSTLFDRLVDVMIRHLEFPRPESGDESDLFDGDRELEEKFREYRHLMGDVLKDCCEVLSVTVCLTKAFKLINDWISTYASQVSGNTVPNWQALEAPLFALRAMGRMVPSTEDVVLHQVIPLIVQIPDHEKLRFQAVMAIGRYTEWTAEHPDYLQPQMNFVISGFTNKSPEVVKAAALAFKFFGMDCRHLLKDEVTNLQQFYNDVLDKLQPQSQEEMTEGAAGVISVQDNDKLYASLKLYIDPIMERLKERANKAKNSPDDKDAAYAVADTLQLVCTFVDRVQVYTGPNEPNPAVTYCQEILPVLSACVEGFPKSTPILEAVCRVWRRMVLSYRTAVAPMLPQLAELLASGFETTRQGCFLWTTDAVVREFSDGAEYVSPETTKAIYAFFEQQAFAFLRVMNDLPPQDLPDVIEDFFRLIQDVLVYYNTQLIPAAICTPILTAAVSSLALEQHAPLTAVLHFIRDFLSYGTDNPASSHFGEQQQAAGGAAPVSQAQLKTLTRTTISNHGKDLVRALLTGMMFHFPDECLHDASGAMLELFRIAPAETGVWIKGTIELLPAGSVKPHEADKLLRAVAQRLESGELLKLRGLLQDFTTSYRRRHVAPREGLGRLEPGRFRFEG